MVTEMVEGLQIGSQGQADLCEFKSNLVYRENSRAAKNAQRNLVSTNKLTAWTAKRAAETLALKSL